MNTGGHFDHAGSRLGTAPRDVLEALLQSIADAVYLVDIDGRVEFANPAALALLGYDEDELLGRLSHPTIHHHHWDGTPFPQDQCPMLAPRTTGETVRIHGDTFWRKDGSKFRVAYTSSPMRTDRGRGAVVVFRDVTAQVEAEQAARHQAAEVARTHELRASRARIIEAADAERRRLVRDLHDGAQQRLVRLLLTVRLAAKDLPADVDAAAGRLAEAADEVERAIAEVRELGSGIRPQILTNRGVAAAVESLTGPLPLPVTIRIPEQRFAERVETAAYFVIAESLTNVVKHARAQQAEVTLAAGGGAGPGQRIVIEVRDDGVGGATELPSGGLAGLRDRVEALDGTLELASPGGGPTVVRAVLPAMP
jgi:PAS domain S-box-containing protein